VIFVIGVLSPLTPSEGQPGGSEIAVFVACPLALFAWVGFKSSRAALKMLAWVQFAAVAFIAWRVLSVVFRL